MLLATRQRDIFYFLFLPFFLVLLAGCTDSPENEGGMLNVPEEGSFHFQAFIEDLPKEGETDAEYERMREVASRSSVKEASIHTETEATIEEYGHLIDDFPTYILIDHSGIVVNTSDIEEVVEFMNSR